MARAFTIELSLNDQTDFLLYLSKNPPAGRTWAETTHRFAIATGDRVMVPGLGAFDYDHDGATYRVEVREEGQARSALGNLAYFQRVLVSGDDLPRLEAFVKTALTAKRSVANRVDVYFSRSRGFWEHYGSVTATPAEYIFLEDGIKADLFRRIDAFKANAARFQTFGRAQKLCVLLAGVSGSGKSSLVKSVALKYDMRLYVMSISKAMTDDALVDVMGGVADRSVVLIEDVDAYFQDRKAADVNVSFSTFINLLSGAFEKGNEMLVFMTTNHPERLDPALLRVGRTDVLYKFDWPKQAEVRDAYVKITGDDDPAAFARFYKRLGGAPLNMASIVKLLFDHGADCLDHVDAMLAQSKDVAQLTAGGQDKMYV